LEFLKTEPSGTYDKATQEAFKAFIGCENFEERSDPSVGWVDKPVLDFIYKKFEK
jgi:hypothetical protein